MLCNSVVVMHLIVCLRISLFDLISSLVTGDVGCGLLVCVWCLCCLGCVFSFNAGWFRVLLGYCLVCSLVWMFVG